MKDVGKIHDNIANGTFTKSTIISTHDRIAYYNSKHIDDGNYLQSLRESFAFFPYTIYFQKYSCFIEPINEQLGRFAANGLLLKWKGVYINLKLIQTKYLELKMIKSRPLKLFDIEGSLMICGCLYFVAAIVLLLEIAIKAIQKKFKKTRRNI